MAARGLFGLISLILVAGALLFMFFIVLAGAVDGNPVNRWYFLEADTSNVPGAPKLSRWTYWNVCEGSSGRDVCLDSTGYGTVSPARPFDPPRNFGTTTNLPAKFVGTHYYYLMTRFMFSFMMIALFFTTCSLFTGLLALCSRIGSYLSGFLATLAFIFQALNAALMTTAFIKGRNAFRAEGRAARIGTYALGFQWAAFVCLFLATVLFCIGGKSSKSDTYDAKTSKGGLFGAKRSKSTRSRGSFITADKEYA